jgi:hypothetical protein
MLVDKGRNEFLREEESPFLPLLFFSFAGTAKQWFPGK